MWSVGNAVRANSSGIERLISIVKKAVKMLKAAIAKSRTVVINHRNDSFIMGYCLLYHNSCLKNDNY